MRIWIAILWILAGANAVENVGQEQGAKKTCENGFLHVKEKNPRWLRLGKTGTRNWRLMGKFSFAAQKFARARMRVTSREPTNKEANANFDLSASPSDHPANGYWRASPI